MCNVHCIRVHVYSNFHVCLCTSGQIVSAHRPKIGWFTVLRIKLTNEMPRHTWTLPYVLPSVSYYIGYDLEVCHNVHYYRFKLFVLFHDGISSLGIVDIHRFHCSSPTLTPCSSDTVFSLTWRFNSCACVPVSIFVSCPFTFWRVIVYVLTLDDTKFVLILCWTCAVC